MHVFMAKFAWLPLLLIFILATNTCWVMVVNGTGEAGVGAPAPTSTSISCANGPLGRLSDCLSFVENGSSVSKPEGSCCSSLKGVVKDSPMCLCEALKAGGADFGIALNITKAFALPAACGISTPEFNFSTCALASPSPSPPPTLQLLPSPPSNPSTAPPASSVLPSLPPPSTATALSPPASSSAAFALLIPCMFSVLSSAAAIICCNFLYLI